MSDSRRRDPSFEITHESDPSDVLVAGFSNYGLAGLTAVNYLVDTLDLHETGHVTAEGFPSITPFENGRPRHPTRLFSRDDLELTVLVGELLVPVQLGESFARSILEWTGANGVSEVVVLSGVPVPHGPEGHRTYYVATDDYREHRLEDAGIEGMASGFLDGTNAALLERGIDSSLEVCVYVTPVHAQVPDVEAAIRLVETVTTVYDVEIDSGPLEAFAAEIQQYYADLAERMEEEQADLPDDRMYM
ncbi:proteasome assembly chaperone family protein [Halopenitus persicus]|uniref:proteasome assembly chaperone family protein n=1 Tax=Halopenitus persicus TaxID=1048396 RepID=UPI000BBABD4F|nr:PAC2 family protein [Halopenitus persicus]